MLYLHCKFIVLNPGEIFNYKNRLIFIRNFSFIINNQYFIRHQNSWFKTAIYKKSMLNFDFNDKFY